MVLPLVAAGLGAGAASLTAWLGHQVFGSGEESPTEETTTETSSQQEVSKDVKSSITKELNESFTEEMIRKIMQPRQLSGDVSSINILLLGCMQAGKSSFTNSVLSALKRNVVYKAITAFSDKPMTQKLEKYRLGKESSLYLWDSPSDLINFNPEELEPILEGEFMSGTKLKDLRRDSTFNAAGTPPCKINCVAVIMNITTFKELPLETRDHILKILTFIRQQGINDVLILTHLDKIMSPHSLPDSYSKPEVSQKLSEAAKTFGVPLQRIFAVSNYFEEHRTFWQKDALILFAMDNILQIAENHISDDW